MNRLDIRQNSKELNIFIEYSKLVSNYYISRRFYADKDYLDAFSMMVNAMHNWAKIIVAKNDKQVETNIWRQALKYNVGVYRLYEELITSDESIDKRVELMQLVITNMVLTKSKKYSKPVLDILNSGSNLVTKNEMEEDLKTGLKDEIWYYMLEDLVNRGIICKVHNNDNHSQNPAYTLNKQ